MVDEGFIFREYFIFFYVLVIELYVIIRWNYDYVVM